MTTISFSVDKDVKRKIDAWAKRAKKSKSAVLRDLVITREVEEYFDAVHKRMEPVLAELGLETEEDIYEYLEGNETYTERKARVAQAKQRQS